MIDTTSSNYYALVNLMKLNHMPKTIRFILIFITLLMMTSCTRIRSWLVDTFTPEYTAEKREVSLVPRYDKTESGLKKIPVGLLPVSQGFSAITDMEFLPQSNDRLVILEKAGRLKVLDLIQKKSYTLAKLAVLAKSEQGLLGIAFHPDYRHNGKFYLNYSVKSHGSSVNRISAWTTDDISLNSSAKLKEVEVILEVIQPYPNHNGGSLVFGPDGMLYIGLGDGGWRGDIGENAQNIATLLGSILRIDVNHKEKGKSYAIPPDNPFLMNPSARHEIWAFGLRNPWKYSFDSRGRLLLADVGQDKYEEVDIIVRGGNYGWDEREATHCYEPSKNCLNESVVDPVYEYTHQEGQSITGGYVYEGSAVKALFGKYILADFVGGWIRAIDLPDSPYQKTKDIYTLGRFDMLISTFARDSRGELYLADYSKGGVYRLVRGD